jgi:hypothetical protein
MSHESQGATLVLSVCKCVCASSCADIFDACAFLCLCLCMCACMCACLFFCPASRRQYKNRRHQVECREPDRPFFPYVPKHSLKHSKHGAFECGNFHRFPAYESVKEERDRPEDKIARARDKIEHLSISTLKGVGTFVVYLCCTAILYLWFFLSRY